MEDFTFKSNKSKSIKNENNKDMPRGSFVSFNSEKDDDSISSIKKKFTKNA